jgi:hypothetical protein
VDEAEGDRARHAVEEIGTATPSSESFGKRLVEEGVAAPNFLFGSTGGMKPWRRPQEVRRFSPAVRFRVMEEVLIERLRRPPKHPPANSIAMRKSKERDRRWDTPQGAVKIERMDVIVIGRDK